MGNKMFPVHPPLLHSIIYTQPRLRVPSIGLNSVSDCFISIQLLCLIHNR